MKVIDIIPFDESKAIKEEELEYNNERYLIELEKDANEQHMEY